MSNKDEKNPDLAERKQFELKEHYTFAELVQLLAFLRSPTGCPWDREQTHQSIKSSIVEEAWETVDAIESGQAERLQDELGDCLLQVVFHAQIAEEQGDFALTDVISGLCHKLISRHTHIFAEDEADTPEEVLATWEYNKKDEKGLLSETEVLLDVPRSIPALSRAYKLQKKAANCGFDWPNVAGAQAKILEESQELVAAHSSQDKAAVEEEAGDLLFAVVNTLRHLGVDPELALDRASNKFIARFAKMEQEVKARGSEIRKLSLAQLDAIWDEVKEHAT